MFKATVFYSDGFGNHRTSLFWSALPFTGWVGIAAYWFNDRLTTHINHRIYVNGKLIARQATYRGV